MKQKTNSLFSILAKGRPTMHLLYLALLLLAITTGVPQKAAAQNCANTVQFPNLAFASPIKGAGPYTITTVQWQSEYNQMTGALAGNTFQSTASIAGTWITVLAGTATGALVAQGSTPLNWTASAGGTYIIHYNTNSDCGTASTYMISTVENTTPICSNTVQFPASAFASPIKGAGPYTITNAQTLSQYNQMTSALAGSTFQSTASIVGTWITVRAGTATGAIVANGSTPLNWTASAGGTYFIHYNTNSVCGTGSLSMITTVENTTPVCGANTNQFPYPFTSPISGVGPYTITTAQYQSEYNQMTGALAGNTFQSTASIAGTWITVRAGTATGAVVAQGSSPLNWTASAGGTYFIHYNTNSDCGTASMSMISTVENTTPNCANINQFPNLAFVSPSKGVGPYTITTAQTLSQYNQMTSALAGSTFQSTASIAGTWITVRAETATGAIVANGSTPLNWTASAGGTYFIHYNTNSACGTAATPMTSTVENTTPVCANTFQFPTLAFASPIKGAGPYTITTAQTQVQYNQMTGALAGSTFQSTSIIAGTWITVRAGSASGAVVAQGSSPLNWTASAGGTYFIHYNTNSVCGTATTNMTSTVENTTPACANINQFPTSAFTAPINGVGPYTIATTQTYFDYNQMTGAVAGNTFQSTASIAGTWITVRAGTAAGAIVAQGSTPLNWTASLGGTYFIHYNTNSVCGTANTGMISAVENFSPVNDACAGASNISALPYTSPVVFNTFATDDYTTSNCDGPYKNLWWKVTGICGTLTASTCGSSFDTELTVFTGSCGSFTQVACNDDIGQACSNNGASVSWAATSGTVYYISAGSWGNISPTGSMQLSVSATPYTAIPAIPAFISGTTAVCANSTQFTYTIDAVANATSYVWTAPTNATLISGQGTTSATFSFQTAYTTGSVSVKSRNCVGTSAARTLAITKAAVPGTVGTISGVTAGACSSGTRTYTVVALTNTTSYNWTTPANASILSGQGTTSVIVQFAAGFTTGTLSVKGVNCSGTSVTARTLVLSKVTATPTVLTGPATAVCAGSTQTYSTTAVAGATSYVWTVPTGALINGANNGISISVTYPSPFTTGAVTVKSATACYTSAAKSATVSSTIAQPGVIAGTSTKLCGGGSYTYTIAAVTGATGYIWSVPPGWTITANTGISVTVSIPTTTFTTATLSVTAQSACGNSTPRTLTLSALPATPTAITGSTSVCASATGLIYSTPVVAGVTSYTWTVPTGAIINSGQNTSSITVTWGTVAGSVTVKAGNICGINATAKTLAVTLEVCRMGEELAEEPSIEVDATSTDLRVYPNPTAGNANVVFGSEVGGKYTINVLNALGQVVYSKTATSTTGENTHAIDISELSSGLYFINLMEDSGMRSMRLVKR